MNSNPENNGFRITETDEGVTFSLHIQPRACRNEISGLSGNELKVRLTSPPVEGAANKLCRDFFAGLLHVPKSNVRIITGEKSRHKTIMIRGTTKDAILALLNKPSRSAE